MDSIHAKVTELLPWYVNGTLPEHDRDEVDGHLGECLVCRAALQEQRRMQSLIQSQDDVPLSAEHNIGGLLERIDAKSGHGRTAMSGSRLALAAGLAYVAIVGSLLLLNPYTPPASSDAEFSTLTDAPSGDLNRVDIVFSEGVESGEILVIVEEFDGQIVSGPTDLGRYTVAISDNSGMSIQDVIDLLAADPRIRFIGQNFIASPPMEDQ